MDAPSSPPGHSVAGSRPLDATGWRILQELQRDARLPFAELGRRVGLTAPAVAERVRRMELAGLIQGYRAEVNRAALGAALTAFVRIRAFPGRDGAIESFAATRGEVLECHEVTGEDSYLLKIAAGSVRQLDRVVTDLAPFGTTHSLLVLSTKVAGKPVSGG
ncbi:Lrp/AsnC family transcriptional regulator [Rhodospirillum centenum]|uniref:Transcriptional regulator, AsnC family protein n=1 Tax=Rhodospirillum centenum (strain ATCC 51521 / SW) TaxID=414684 RepID=B6IQZ6_RHOCS|nr:Lrp/AsnC family transcriptional regulator [Rhodospirillum centenum]ACI97882.1 transcriptional regulator, AsnC family protein [Rhodospirillum centenum SW]